MMLVTSRPVSVAASTPRPLSPNSESGNDLRLTIGCVQGMSERSVRYRFAPRLLHEAFSEMLQHVH
jgi:hypothetical protein